MITSKKSIYIHEMSERETEIVISALKHYLSLSSTEIDYNERAAADRLCGEFENSLNMN